MPSVRILRVRELLKREIGEIIRRELPLSRTGLITVNEVVVSKDFHNATVFVGIIGTEHQQQKGLETLRKERIKIQALLSRAVVLKYTPQLQFNLDESISRGNRVLEILDEIEKSNPSHEEPPKDH
ncbi:MAG: 30S ribosome-binding factor RbfA [Verrucomicrobia bacterium]|nr:30S ribosome-binding factor RbfA [Verrucomicrobiota bacterium]